MTEQELRTEHPQGTVYIRIDDEVRPMTNEEYEKWIANSLQPPAETPA